MKEFAESYSPVTAYAVSTRPLPRELLDSMMPSRSTMEQYPLNLHSFVIDDVGRLVMSLLPRATCPEDAEAHFQDQLRWVHKTWPQSRDFDVKMEDYWTGAMAFARQTAHWIDSAAKAQVAAWLGIDTCNRFIGRIGIGQYPLGVFQVALPGFGRANVTRGTV